MNGARGHFLSAHHKYYSQHIMTTRSLNPYYNSVGKLLFWTLIHIEGEWELDLKTYANSPSRRWQSQVSNKGWTDFKTHLLSTNVHKNS